MNSSPAPRKAPHWSLPLRHLTRTSIDKLPAQPLSSPDTVSSNSAAHHAPQVRPARMDRKCTVTVNESFARDEVLINLALFDDDIKPGSLMAIDAILDKPSYGNLRRHPSQDQPKDPPDQDLVNDNVIDVGRRYLFIVKDMPKELRARYPTVELYVAKHIADAFGMKKGSTVLLTPVDSSNPIIEASHVELSFKDQYLSRSDMWRMALAELAERTVYKGQLVLFMGTIKAQVTAVFVEGKKVQSAFFGKNTRPIFRSESARYVLFIQMAREMWDFASDGSGDILFSKVVDGFLPVLFKKWVALKVKHLVSIVLFARVEYDTGLATEFAEASVQNDYYTGIQSSADRRPYKDFYRVVVSEMASVEWTKILYQLKREFNYFRRDISLYHQTAMASPGTVSQDTSANTAQTQARAESSLAMYGNFLEAINLASSLFAHDYIDRDLLRTGISAIVISPGTGVFEVEYEALRRTTEALVGNGIGIDLICVPKMPLHSVPLFRYRNPYHVGSRYGSKSRHLFNDSATPKLSTPVVGSYSSFPGSFSPSKGTSMVKRLESVGSAHANDEWCFALPQWLHVSYWTGNADETLFRQGDTLLAAKSDQQAYQNEFAIRCRMYDLQMRSVLQTNEIETAPLHSEALFPHSTFQLHPGVTPRPVAIDNIVVVHNRRIPEAIYEPVHGFQKFAPDRNAKHGEKSIWKQLQEFDESHARLPSLQRNVAGSSHKGGLDDGTKRPLGDDTVLFSTSLAERRSSVTSQALPLGSSYKSAADRYDHTNVPRLSIDRESLNSRLSPTKTPKFMRQISLGQKGFGVAAPKVAMAEVRAETATASKSPAPVSRPHPLPRATTSTLNRRPGSAQDIPSSESDKTALEEARYLTLDSVVESTQEVISRPIVIKSTQGTLDTSTQRAVKLGVASTTARSEISAVDRDLRNSNILRADDVQKVYNSKLLAEAVPELPTTLSPTTALSPWLTILNPSNPNVNQVDDASLHSRWQHVFPLPYEMTAMKWKSLCSPASVPLTTEYFPTKAQLESEYQQQPYSISQELDDELAEEPKTREDFLRELISLRFSQGFQVIIGPAITEVFGQKQLKISDIFSPSHLAEDGTSIFMSVGTTIHQLSCVDGTEVEVNIFTRKPTEPFRPNGVEASAYKPAIRTLLDQSYRTTEIDILTPKPERNWSYIDSYISGQNNDLTEHLRFWRARFVLIPMSSRSSSIPKAGDSEEEIRLEGIRRLCQLWQKHRYILPHERRFQNLGPRKKRDPNPLDIVYKTDDPSLVIAAELETLPLLEGLDIGNRKGQLVTSRDQFRRSDLNLSALAEAIQQPVENGGVRMQNRRWHLRLHYNCFIGSDMTSWLLNNFEDLESREEAEALGNELMMPDEDRAKDKEKEGWKELRKEQGIFVHVEKRHTFRDGQYFYQISSDYAKPHPAGWLSRRRETSVPSTPLSENTPRDSPRAGMSRSTSIHEENSPISGSTTPTVQMLGGKKPRVVLSKVMKYDVDQRKRSYRPERIDLHYDRLHNPDNCYHIRIDWMNVTAKLIEDALEGWAREALTYGMRLVEVPLAEACAISDVNPFRSPYHIELALPTPDEQPVTYYDPNSFTPQVQPGKHFYQKAILRRFDFVLDVEAASNFPSNVDVSYSWGKPSYKYSQYIHRSGLLLAQITDDGDFLLLANRLYGNRAWAVREKEMRGDQATIERAGPSRVGAAYTPYGITEPTPLSSPMVRSTFLNSPVVRSTAADPPTKAATAPAAPEALKDELEAFCRDSTALELFFKETLEKAAVATAPTPAAFAGTHSGVPDTHIPVLGLPPGLLTAESGNVRVGSPAVLASQVFRRGSVQDGMMGQSVRER